MYINYNNGERFSGLLQNLIGNDLEDNLSHIDFLLIKLAYP